MNATLPLVLASSLAGCWMATVPIEPPDAKPARPVVRPASPIAIAPASSIEMGSTAMDQTRAELEQQGEPAVTIGGATVESGYDASAVSRTFHGRRQELVRCYASRNLAPLDGTMTVSFTIAADGHVTSASAGPLHVELDACVSGVVMTLTFPAPRTGRQLVASIPLTFTLH